MSFTVDIVTTLAISPITQARLALTLLLVSGLWLLFSTKWCNRETRDAQNVVPTRYESSNLSLVIRTRVRRQVSRVRRHLRLRPTDSCLLIPISFLMTQADECPGEPHKLPRPGATPGPATSARLRFRPDVHTC